MVVYYRNHVANNTSCVHTTSASHNKTRALSSTKPLARCMALLSYMVQQLYAEKGVAKGLWTAGVGLLGLGMRLMHSSVIQGSTAHSSNNPGMLYRAPH